MFILNDEMIRDYMNEHLLCIGNFKEKMLHPTYYYFRLGKCIPKWNGKGKYENGELGDDGNEVFVMPPKSYVPIRSLERFYCSDKVLAMFGQISELPMDGLRLNHSPTIDPNFGKGKLGGVLEMGIENLLNQPNRLKYAMPIGKISFFDISDTSHIGDIENSISAPKYKRRGAIPLG
jgi:deoxycytidine triphosphate deaminase